jgi:beta-lactamase regulating signal transducer with metallopeptidase domain
MNFLYQSAFAGALGWSLIDSLWQMGAIWICYIIITGNSTRFSSQKRHSLALLGSAAGTLCFFISLVFNYYSGINDGSYLSLAYFIEEHASETIIGYALADDFVPFISFIYLPIVVFFFFRLLLQACVYKNIYRKDLLQPDSKIEAFVNTACEQLGILKKVTVWISRTAEGPLTIGFWKPVIFLPVAMFSHLSCAQVEAVLTHELQHIKRNDYVINILLTIAEVLLFFNPFARTMFAIVKKERENSCDDQVIAAGFDAWEYSQALYTLGKYRNEKKALAIAATGEGKEYLLQRIRRMMKRKNPSPSVLKPIVAFFLCLFVAGFAVRHSQVQVLPEVALSKNIKTVVYYSVQKQITPDDPPKAKVAPIKEKKKITAKKVIKAEVIVLAPAPSESSLPEEISDEHFRDMISKYVAVPQVLEFTIIDPVKPSVPDIVCESPQPYIQKSSFYFTDVDTTTGRKVVEL